MYHKFETGAAVAQAIRKRRKQLTQRAQGAQNSQRREKRTGKENREKRKCGALERGSPDPSTAQRLKSPLLRSG